jgi:hypothetical protein
MTLGLSLWLALRTLSFFRAGRQHDVGEWVFYSIFVLLVLMAYLALAFALHESSRLQKDIELERIYIFRREANPLKSKPTQEAPTPKAEVVEMLPVSHKVWTEDGRPATWRLLAPDIED